MTETPAAGATTPAATGTTTAAATTTVATTPTATPATKPAEGGTTTVVTAKPADGGEVANSGAQGGPKETPKAVEYTDFTLPQGMALEADAAKTVKTSFGKLGLTQAQAQGVLDTYGTMSGKIGEASVKAANEANRKNWLTAATADADIGGDETKLKASAVTGGKALAKFGDAALVKELNETGFGNNPHLIRFMRNVGRAIREPETLAAGGGTSGPANPADILYPPKAAE